MFAREVILTNKTGFHLRPAQLFVEKAAKYDAKISVKTDTGANVDGKSILGLMALGLKPGAKITIQAEGIDEVEAVNALVELVERKFGEE
ncbi:HPr family phosphocarrier protein [Carboxydothermus ferrireducens]|uniref:Phosphocarrier protein HPr/phosphocarrier protein n=1 Tax=Carboxydothermus ferrireducens DSM 11255 TaxID=1119529 RepID=A0ABX2R974_9THEO|nr:HPr family phosphocarrier protein [Carboxydothermus ferrireducens]NYE56410.1 phosphocarrier protein HPr/phosphocarrier protein [Carboxydothermus ferrireducens DSM 11255]